MENLNNQGKNRKKYETSAITAFYGWCGVVGMVVLLVIFTLLSSCSTTKEVEHPEVLKKSQVSNTVDKCCTPKTIKE